MMRTRTLILAFALVASACVRPRPGAPDVDATPVSDEAVSVARDDLDALYARSVTRALDRADPATRKRRLAARARRGDDGATLPMRMTSAGTPRQILAPDFAISAAELGLAATAEPRAIAAAFIRRFGVVWRVRADEFLRAAETRIDEHASPLGRDVVTVRFRQRYRGLKVVGGEIAVHIEKRTGDVTGVTGSALPFEHALGIAPAVTSDRAVAVARGKGEKLDAGPTLVFWSGFRSGGAPEPRLAWELRVIAADAIPVVVWIDATTGRELARSTDALFELRRVLWDLRATSPYGQYTCQLWRWGIDKPPWPQRAAGCTHPTCAQCRAAIDTQECARCPCRDASRDPAECERFIFRYDDASGGCVANGDPAGETACDPEARQLWDDAGTAYDYWRSTFARDGWDGAGGWLQLEVNHAPPTYFGGVTQRIHVADRDELAFVSVIMKDGLADVQRHGHELGHALQNGTYNYNDLSGMYRQTIDVLEHNADVHGFRYRGLVPQGRFYECGGNFDHYTKFGTIVEGQANKLIGNCHGWLLLRSGAPFTHYGVTVTPIAVSAYEQIAYRALDVYFTGGDDYFDWWNQLIVSAAALYGTASQEYTSTVAARDAVGGWTPLSSLPVGTTGVHADDRFAAARGASGPCVFYRYSGSTSAIYWSCLETNGWTRAARLNDPALDPAASEPAAAYRRENGAKIYVAWRGTDDRIHYRRFVAATHVVGPPRDLGPTHLTSAVPAIASIHDTMSTDRLVFVYHPRKHPAAFVATHLGSTAPATSLGATLDSDAPPSVVAFPYGARKDGGNRIYFVRPDSASSATPGHLRYAAYSLTRGWSGAASLTALYEGVEHLPPNVVRSDRGVALAEYNRTAGTTRLRMAFVTTGDEAGGQRELWYATLAQSTPGTLVRAPDYRAVPLAPVTSGTHQSAGALAIGDTRSPLYHFWGDAGPIGKLAAWRTFSD